MQYYIWRGFKYTFRYKWDTIEQRNKLIFMPSRGYFAGLCAFAEPSLGGVHSVLFSHFLQGERSTSKARCVTWWTQSRFWCKMGLRIIIAISYSEPSRFRSALTEHETFRTKLKTGCRKSACIRKSNRWNWCWLLFWFLDFFMLTKRITAWNGIDILEISLWMFQFVISYVCQSSPFLQIPFNLGLFFSFLFWCFSTFVDYSMSRFH